MVARRYPFTAQRMRSARRGGRPCVNIPTRNIRPPTHTTPVAKTSTRTSPTGGVIVAGLFALAHVESFWTGSPLYAAGQQVYAIGAGLCLAYLYAKSRSLLAPIIAHNIANGIEITAVFILKSQGF